MTQPLAPTPPLPPPRPLRRGGALAKTMEALEDLILGSQAPQAQLLLNIWTRTECISLQKVVYYVPLTLHGIVCNILDPCYII